MRYLWKGFIFIIPLFRNPAYILINLLRVFVVLKKVNFFLCPNPYVLFEIRAFVFVRANEHFQLRLWKDHYPSVSSPFNGLSPSQPGKLGKTFMASQAKFIVLMFILPELKCLHDKWNQLSTHSQLPPTPHPVLFPSRQLIQRQEEFPLICSTSLLTWETRV